MKISHFEQIITPEIGTCVAGYYAHDESTEILDDLKLSILLMDDGKKTGAILGFDLLGLDVDIVNNITRDAAEEKLFDNPQLFNTPIVRNGQEVTVGYHPEIWEKWD